MTVGQTLITTQDIIPWYSGYGENPYVVIPAGTAATVTHANVYMRTKYHVAEAHLPGTGRWQFDITDKDPRVRLTTGRN